jgi:hypothetical protein
MERHDDRTGQSKKKRRSGIKKGYKRKNNGLHRSFSKISQKVQGNEGKSKVQEKDGRSDMGDCEEE